VICVVVGDHPEGFFRLPRHLRISRPVSGVEVRLHEAVSHDVEVEVQGLRQLSLLVVLEAGSRLN